MSGPLAVVESPYAGNVERNTKYLRACMRDCLLRGEAPFASHGLYTQPGVLDDTVPAERTHGIEAGFRVAEALAAKGAIRAIYTDEGISGGMRYGVAHALKIGQMIEYRTVPGWKIAAGAL